MPFTDGTGGTSTEPLGELSKLIFQVQGDVSCFRATFMELVLCLALDKADQDAEAAVRMIRDQLTALTAGVDGVSDELVHPILLKAANEAMQ